MDPALLFWRRATSQHLNRLIRVLQARTPIASPVNHLRALRISPKTPLQHRHKSGVRKARHLALCANCGTLSQHSSGEGTKQWKVAASSTD